MRDGSDVAARFLFTGGQGGKEQYKTCGACSLPCKPTYLFDLRHVSYVTQGGRFATLGKSLVPRGDETSGPLEEVPVVNLRVP